MERKRDRESMVESSGTENMEKDRSKVAAMSVMPFSCIICFEEFCSVERPPMVLPCGHTYVCLPCTKRLKKCMECRQPLFLPAPPTATIASLPKNYLNPQQQQQQLKLERRYGPSSLHNENSTNAHQQPPTPLPIPKNLVLLSVMDAAERQSRVALIPSSLSLQVSSSTPSASASASASAAEEDEQIDFNKIITGMAALSGPCGTYAVRERNGLLVVPHDPRKQNVDACIEVPELLEDIGEPTTTAPTATGRLDENDMDIEEKEDESSSAISSNENEPSLFAEEEVDCDQVQIRRADDESDLTHCIQRDKNESVEEEEEKEESFIIQSRLPFELAPRPKELPEQQEQQQLSSSTLLEYGQTVQVISFYGGVAKLARDKGYIAASPRQLVKVGEPLDEACRLQGLIDTVSCRGKGLEKILEENRLIAEALQRQLDTAVDMEPNHPIISLKNSENRAPTVGATTSPRTPNGPAYSPPLSSMQTPKKTYSFEPLTPTQHRTGSFDLKQHHGSSCRISPAPRTPEFDMDGIRIGFAAAPTMPRYADRGSMDEQDKMEFGCGSSFMGAGGAELFGEGFAGSHDLSDDDYDHHHRDHHHHHATSHTRSGGGGGGHGVPSLNPSLSASFDVVDFRTGMSCHRALNASKFGRSPKPAPRRQVRTMGDHRGIAPMRSTFPSQQRLQPNNAPMFPTYSTPTGEEVSWYKE